MCAVAPIGRSAAENKERRTRDPAGRSARRSTATLNERGATLRALVAGAPPPTPSGVRPTAAARCRRAGPGRPHIVPQRRALGSRTANSGHPRPLPAQLNRSPSDPLLASHPTRSGAGDRKRPRVTLTAPAPGPRGITWPDHRHPNRPAGIRIRWDHAGVSGIGDDTAWPAIAVANRGSDLTVEREAQQLRDRALRLLAVGVGDHTPIEVQEEVAQIAHRLAQLEPPVHQLLG